MLFFHHVWDITLDIIKYKDVSLWKQDYNIYVVQGFTTVDKSYEYACLCFEPATMLTMNSRSLSQKTYFIFGNSKALHI